MRSLMQRQVRRLPRFRDLSIRRKLTVIIMATSAAALLLAGAALVFLGVIDFRRDLGVSLLVLAAALLVVLLLSTILQRVISEPLQRLVQTAEAASDPQDFAVRATRSTDDEVGVLAVTFDGMLEQIRQRNAALTSSLARLEKTQASLAERTLEVERISLEQARTLEALRESEERYSLAARGANDGLWDWDLRRGEIYFSPRWKSMLGLGEGDISNRPEEWLERVHPEDLERLRADIAAHVQGLTLHFENEHRLMHRDGSFRWMLTRGLAVRG